MLKHINFPDDLIKAIDDARSDDSFTAWVIEACRNQLASEELSKTQLDRIENMLISLSKTKATPKQPSEPSGDVRKKTEPTTLPTKKNAVSRPRGELSEAQLLIIDLDRKLKNEGAKKVDHLIADALNEKGILTPTGGEWDNRRVMNAKTRLKGRGVL